MNRLERTLIHFREFRAQNVPASTAMAYARARVWLDDHAYIDRAGNYCKPATLADAEACGYTGIVWTFDDLFDPDDFYGLEEPAQTRLTNALKDDIKSGRVEVLVCFLLVDGVVRDSIGSVALRTDKGRDSYAALLEVELANAHLENEREVDALVRTGFAL